jgi:chromatin structure-remodeling complex subunit SFH1
VTLIPIRIDLDVPSFTPAQALPLPADAAQFGINPAHPAYKIPEATPPYRLKDVFLWNLHETLITPDAFALVLVNELDLPNPAHYALQISGQIRQQLEEYAGVALHPLFHSSGTGPAEAVVPRLLSANISRDQSQTPGIPSTPGGNGTNLFAQRSGNESPAKPIDSITAEAVPIPSEPGDINNPDDTYRCIVNLNINLLNKLYTDKFEWSLLHPPGFAEDFARQTCADLGLAGEWVPTMAHAIYEAVLRLKKDACENGGLVGAFGTGEIDNLAIEGQEAGWRYEPEQLAEEWEPKVEIMSKEDIERREIDRERQIRRLRRETARFSSTANMAGGVPTPGALFDQPDPDTPMGRGERSKKKRRFRSLSPQGRGGTPGGTMSDNTSYGGGAGAPNDK